MTVKDKSPHFDVAAIKRAASGRWREIHTTVGGVSADVLDGKHHPCEECGGKDRFRMVDADTGRLHCNQCFNEKNGDGIAALMWAQGWNFPTAIEKLAAFLGIEPENKANTETSDPIQRIKNRRLPADCTDLVKQFCEAKPPITPEAVAKYCGIGGFLGHACLVFQGQNLKGVGTGVLVMRADGEPFPAFGNLSERKTHNLGGSTEGWIAGKVDDLPGNVAAMKAAGWVVKTEGPGDLLAIVSTEMPDGWIAVSNLCGAKSASKLAFGWTKGKDVVIVADADEPGIEGAKRFAAEFLKAGAASVRIVELPYEVTPNQGKDLRDWLAEGHGFADFQKLVESTKPVTAEAPHLRLVAANLRAMCKACHAKETGRRHTGNTPRGGGSDLSGGSFSETASPRSIFRPQVRGGRPPRPNAPPQVHNVAASTYLRQTIPEPTREHYTAS